MVTKHIKISSKSQITIPQMVLKKLGIGPGDAIQLNVLGQHAEILVAKSKQASALDLGKKFKSYPKKPLSVKQINVAIDEGYANLARKNK